jgi:hypothetical protein
MSQNPHPQRTKILLYKEDHTFFFSHYSAVDPIRKEPLWFQPDIPTSLRPLIDSGRTVIAEKGSNGEWAYAPATSNTIQLKVLHNTCLVMDDDELGIENEILLSPILQMLTLIYGEIPASPTDDTAPFLTLTELETLAPSYDIVIQYVNHEFTCEMGVNYKLVGGHRVPTELTTIDQLMWLCSCFRHYFDFNNPPRFIGINLTQKPNPKKDHPADISLPSSVVDRFHL